jgi:glucoamylase
VGFSKPDDDLGGYHLVWPRDLVEIAGGFIRWRATSTSDAWLRYLQVTQEPDGHWSQNMWLDGTPYWRGIHMDETALPILLVDLAARQASSTRIGETHCGRWSGERPHFSRAMVP